MTRKLGRRKRRKLEPNKVPEKRPLLRIHEWKLNDSRWRALPKGQRIDPSWLDELLNDDVQSEVNS
jgi:hypothetical protein